MPLPRSVALLNKRFTNRFIEPVVSRSRRFAVVTHVGRVSGRCYRTPVVGFTTDAEDELLVALTYGPGADWFRNVRIGGGRIDLRGPDRTIVASIVVGRDAAWPHLPAVVRLGLRILRVNDFALLRLHPVH